MEIIFQYTIINREQIRNAHQTSVQNLFVPRQSMLPEKDFYAAKCFHPEQHWYRSYYMTGKNQTEAKYLSFGLCKSKSQMDSVLAE